MNFVINKIRREIHKSYGPEIKIDLPVKKYSDVSKVNRAKSPLFFPLESLETRLHKFSNGLVNSRTASNISKLDSSLDPRSFRQSRIENWVSSIALRETVSLHLNGTVYADSNESGQNHLQWLEILQTPWSVIHVIFKTSSVTPDFFYVFNLI